MSNLKPESGNKTPDFLPEDPRDKRDKAAVALGTYIYQKGNKFDRFEDQYSQLLTVAGVAQADLEEASVNGNYSNHKLVIAIELGRGFIPTVAREKQELIAMQVELILAEAHHIILTRLVDAKAALAVANARLNEKQKLHDVMETPETKNPSPEPPPALT